MSVNRRGFVRAIGGAGIVGVAGCLGSDDDTTQIGALLPHTGPLSLFAQENERGYEFAVNQLSEEILDKEIEIIDEDTQAEPATAVERARKLVEEDDVDALVGTSDSAAGLAVGEYLNQQAQIPLIVSQVATVGAREEPDNCNPYWFFPWPSMRQMNLANIEFISNELENAVDDDIDTSRVHFVAEDYEAGQSARDIFEESFDGEMTGSTMPPQGETDFSPYFPSIEDADADVISGFVPGESAVRFVQQASDYGLHEEKVMCFLGDTTSQIPLGQIGTSADSWYGTHWYDEKLKHELNEDYKSWYNGEFDLPPNDIAVNGFNQLYSLGRAMEEAGTTDPDDVIEQLEGFTFDSPMGELTYRSSDHQTELNFAGYGIEAGDRNVIAEYDEVIGESYCDV